MEGVRGRHDFCVDPLARTLLPCPIITAPPPRRRRRRRRSGRGGAPLCVGSVGWGIGFLYDQCLLSALCVGSGEAGEAPCLRARTDALERASCVTPTQTSVAGAMLGSGREGIPFEVSSSERGFWVIMGRQEDKEKTLPSVDCFKALSYRI